MARSNAFPIIHGKVTESTQPGNFAGCSAERMLDKITGRLTYQ
jgi:hypothetical protein